jgi:membrane protein DedA with SNARE-associated domain
VPTILESFAHLTHFQICALATYLLLQGTVFAIAPEEVIFMSMGVLWSQGRVGLFEALLACFAGLLPANSLMVYVAGRFKRNSLIQKATVQRALALVKAKGKLMIVITRFTPLFRFFVIDALSSLIQVPMLLLIGAWIERKTGSITDAYKVIAAIALTAAATVVITYLITERRRKALSPLV